MTWYQPETRLDRWLELYRAVARGNGAEPDAGRRLLDWAHAARYREVVSTATVWCYGTPQGRAWWVGCGRNASRAPPRLRESRSRRWPGGWLTKVELDDLAVGWRHWATHPDGWFAVLNAEVLCSVT